jgi:hypothetical protein
LGTFAWRRFLDLREDFVQKMMDFAEASGSLSARPKTVASVAQLVEQLTLNQLVLGSSPSRGTTFFIGESGTAW